MVGWKGPYNVSRPLAIGGRDNHDVGMTTTSPHRATDTPDARTQGLGFTIQAIGGPTAVLELGGLRLLTDPTFDAPGRYPGGSTLVKTAPSALTADEVGPVERRPTLPRRARGQPRRRRARLPSH